MKARTGRRHTDTTGPASPHTRHGALTHRLGNLARRANHRNGQHHELKHQTTQPHTHTTHQPSKTMKHRTPTAGPCPAPPHGMAPCTMYNLTVQYLHGVSWQNRPRPCARSPCGPSHRISLTSRAEKTKTLACSLAAVSCGAARQSPFGAHLAVCPYAPPFRSVPQLSKATSDL